MFQYTQKDILPRSFYRDESRLIAPKLLGKYVIRRIGDEILVGKIVETEAYLPFIDTAAHSYKGKTPRTAVLWGEPGFTYVYSIHKYHSLDIATSEVGIPGAVLIRAVEPIEGIEMMKKLRGVEEIQKLTSGPGKLCQAMIITRELNGVDVTNPQSPIFILEGEVVKADEIATSTRIGVTSAKELEMRFFIKNNSFVSK